MKKLLAIAAITFVAGAAIDAKADIFSWDWTPASPGSYGLNHRAGTFESVHATWNHYTDETTWVITFADQVAQGYTLAVSPGPNPKGSAAELALVYFDARDMNNVKVSAYAYNGLNALTSYKDGTPITGNQTPDRVVTGVTDTEIPFNFAATAQDIGSKRVFTLWMDATPIQEHNPLYAQPEVNDWTGFEFGPQLGLWLHPIKGLSATYNDEGYLTNWSGTDGWLDGSGFSTRSVPTPGGFALMSLGVIAAARRNRKR